VRKKVSDGIEKEMRGCHKRVLFSGKIYYGGVGRPGSGSSTNLAISLAPVKIYLSIN
jgi:hypothetical protein